MRSVRVSQEAYYQLWCQGCRLSSLLPVLMFQSRSRCQLFATRYHGLTFCGFRGIFPFDSQKSHILNTSVFTNLTLSLSFPVMSDHLYLILATIQYSTYFGPTANKVKWANFLCSLNLMFPLLSNVIKFSVQCVPAATNTPKADCLFYHTSPLQEMT